MVDNASSDGTEASIRTLFKDVVFIANTENVGFSAANNQGYARAKGQVILLLNPDAKLINADIKKALAYLHNHPSCILGPRILNPDGSLQGSVIAMPGFTDVLAETFFLTYFFKKYPGHILKKKNYALTGACLMLTHHNYGLLQGLDENLFWMDDIDFCFRAKKLGLDIVYFPDWSVIHVIGQSGKKNYKVAISNQLLSKLKFFKKHQQHLNFILSAVLIQIHILTRMLLFLPVSVFNPVYRMKFLAYIHAQRLFFKYTLTKNNKTF